MGLGIGAIQLNLELWQRGRFKNLRSVMEMGAQELHLEQPDFANLLNSVAIPDEKKKQFLNQQNWPPAAKDFYRLLGIEEYSRIDLNGRAGALALDLNYPLADQSLYNKYDLVTDYGSNEHAFNVAEAYRSLHRLCRPQGIIVIIQALWKGNGYYLFDQPFFTGLAAANDYKILLSSYMVTLPGAAAAGSANQFHIPACADILGCIDLARVSSVEICYVFQKQSGLDFRFPYQPDYLVFLKQGGRLFPQLPAAGQTSQPVYEPVLEFIKTGVLFKHLVRRIISKGNRALKFSG